MMRTFAAVLLLASGIMHVGCSKEGSPAAAPTASHEAAADLRVVLDSGGKPMIIATARVPLDDSAVTSYFIALDGNTLFGDRYENTLPIKPPDTKYRFGTAWEYLPIEVLDEKISNEAIEASQKGDIAALDRIASSLKGRVSFFYETAKMAYNDH